MLINASSCIQLLWLIFLVLTVPKLMETENITEKQMDTPVEEDDLPWIAQLLDNTDEYVEPLGLTSGEQNDVQDIVARASTNQTQRGVKLTLKYWQNKNPKEATYRKLLNILLKLKKGSIAIKLCKYMASKCELKFLLFYSIHVTIVCLPVICS